MKENTYRGLLIQGTIEDHNHRYLDNLISTMKYSITAYPRTYVVRIDLRLPEDDLSLDFLSRYEIVGYNQNRKNLMKKFTESLNAKIKA